MIAVRVLHREEWEADLRSYDCKPLEGLTKLNTAEWWQYPWGHPFTVPCDETGLCEYWAYNQLIADMARCAPPDWVFPPGPRRPRTQDTN